MSDGTNAFKIVYSASLLGPAKTPRGLEGAVSDTLAPGTPWWTEEKPVPLPVGQARSVDSVLPAPVAVPTRVLLEGADTVTTTPGRAYPAGRMKRFFLGDLNRHLWSVPVTLPVLDLDRVGGGMPRRKRSAASRPWDCGSSPVTASNTSSVRSSRTATRPFRNGFRGS